MSYIQHDPNNEQMLVPITVMRGGTRRGLYFKGKNVPKVGDSLAIEQARRRRGLRVHPSIFRSRRRR